LKNTLVLAHFFRVEENAIHSSTNERMRGQRMAAFEKTVTSWRAIFNPSATLNIEHRKFLPSPSTNGDLDIIVLINENHHLIRSEFCDKNRLKIIQVKTDNPRFLPFAAHRVMADLRNEYDRFFYSEDDLAIRDGSFLSKLNVFQEAFGVSRVLQPNRFEINPASLHAKTYIDGDLRANFIEPFLKLVNEDQNSLSIPFLGQAITLLRARNPHSGFFALTADQLKHWIQQKHFNDLDTSFVSPLESAATLGLLKTFSVFKASPPHQHFFEIEHLDQKFSSLRLPVAN
jgi:hypothetical protein